LIEFSDENCILSLSCGSFSSPSGDPPRCAGHTKM
jgi:hypothetical protein